jgi:hypothetical protein
MNAGSVAAMAAAMIGLATVMAVAVMDCCSNGCAND